MSRKRFIIIAIFLLLGFCSAFAQEYLDAMPYWWKGRNFTGEITRVEGNLITITNLNNEKKKFEINSLTKLFLRSSDHLKEGLFVKMVYKKTRQKNIARAVRELKRLDQHN